MKTNRPLASLKSKSPPGQFVFFDSETLPRDVENRPHAEWHTFRLGCATRFRLEKWQQTRRFTWDFSDTKHFWSELINFLHPRIVTWVFAHNIGFDLTILDFWSELEDGTFTFGEGKLIQKPRSNEKKGQLKMPGFFIAKDPPTVLKCFGPEGQPVVFCDSMNFWKTSLDNIGKDFGLKKTKMPDFSAPDRDWFPYCRRDVDVLETAVMKLVEWVYVNDLGKFSYTAPSQAMKAFRHRWNDPPLQIHNDSWTRKLEREAYYGGRLECFHIGKKKETIYELDVVSLYPSVMKDGLYPTELMATSHNRSMFHVTPEKLDLSYVAEVDIETTGSDYPLRCKSGTVYPTESFTTVLCGPELVEAVESGSVQKVHRWSRYRLAPIFNGFVEYFWSERLAAKLRGDKSADTLCKLMMNSLYGKFGQMTDDWANAIDPPDDLLEWEENITCHADGQISRIRKRGNLVEQYFGKSEHSNAFPAVAAFVTAYGRMRMLELMRIAGRENVFYCVTDALHVNQTGFDNLNSSGEIADNVLGRLGIKVSGESAEWECLHHWKIGRKQKFGSRKSKAYVDKDGTVHELHFQNLASILKREPKPRVMVYPVEKVFSKTYLRGQVDADGKVHPLPGHMFASSGVPVAGESMASVATS